MSSRPFGRGSSTGGYTNYSTDMGLEGNVPANVIVRAGKNLRETIDPTEEFLLPVGEKRVVMKCDKDDPTTAVFTFNRDGQTLGGLLVSALLALPCVTFAAYKVPHPLFFVFELRLTTDGTMDPKEALLEASKNMVEDLVMLSRRFTHEWELLKQAKMTEGAGNGDFEMASGRAIHSRAVSSTEEAVSQGRGFQGRERSQQYTRYQSGAGSPERPGYLGGGSPVRPDYRGEGKQRIGSQAGPSSLAGVEFQMGSQLPGYQGRARSPEKFDTPTGRNQDGSSRSVGNYEAGFQPSWASGQQARSPDRMNYQGGIKAGSPPDDLYGTSAVVPDRSVNQAFRGNEKLEHQTDSQTEGCQGYSSQGLGRVGYQLGGQQATTTQAGGDWTPEYQHLTNQGSSYQNHPQSSNRGYYQGRADDQAMDPQTHGYQDWGHHRRQKEDTDALKDTAMDDNDW